MRVFAVVFACVAFAPLGVYAQTSAEAPADEMLARMESAMYPASFFMRVSLETHRPDRRGSSITMESHHKEDVGTLIEVVAPSRSRGMRFLQKDESLWMYNPRAGGNRAIRLSPRESFQGSVFSNNDVGDPTYTDDYAARYRADETIEHPTLGRVETHVIVAEAKHEEAAYGMIIAWVRTEDAAPVQMDLYAKSGLLFKRMILKDFRMLAGRMRASVIRMESIVQDNTYSVATIDALEVRDDLSNRMFTEAHLTR